MPGLPEWTQNAITCILIGDNQKFRDEHTEKMTCPEQKGYDSGGRDSNVITSQEIPRIFGRL